MNKNNLGSSKVLFSCMLQNEKIFMETERIQLLNQFFHEFYSLNSTLLCQI